MCSRQTAELKQAAHVAVASIVHEENTGSVVVSTAEALSTPYRGSGSNMYQCCVLAVRLQRQLEASQRERRQMSRESLLYDGIPHPTSIRQLRDIGLD